jgi:hypothetical protein
MSRKWRSSMKAMISRVSALVGATPVRSRTNGRLVKKLRELSTLRSSSTSQSTKGSSGAKTKAR